MKIVIANDRRIHTMFPYPDIRIMMRIGSLATTMQNMAKAGPKAIKVQPINSANVIVQIILEKMKLGTEQRR